MGSGVSKPGWYPGEPRTEALHDKRLCGTTAGLGGGGVDGDGSTTTATPSTSLRSGGSFSMNGAREITRLPVVELTEMEFIANGTFCSVFACKYRGWSVVAKRVRADLPLSERRAALDNLWTEYDCLRPLHHPNVIDVYGMCRVKCRDDYCDWNEKDVCLLLEQLALGTVGHLFGTTHDVEKNLSTALARSRKMKMVPFRYRLDRALELALALEYVHGGAGIGTMMHRDIKSVNVGFALNGNLKLMDFGLSRLVAPHGAPENDTYQMTGKVGSYRYMAPELVRHEPYNAKADIYSWAILSWEVLAVSRPYAGITESSFIKRVVMNGYRPELQKSWPERLRVLLTSAWHADYSKRPTAAEIVSVLEDIKANLPEKGQRRPFTTAASFSNTKCFRCNSQMQQSVSAPGSMCHGRRRSGGGVGGGGGRDVPPAASPDGKQFSLPVTRATRAAKRRWCFGAKASTTPRQASGTSRPKHKTKTTLPLPLPLTQSFSSTATMPNTAKDDERGTEVAAADGGCLQRPYSNRTSPPYFCHHRREGTSQRESIAEALAQETEDAQQEALAREASAQQEAAARAVKYMSRTVEASGRVTETERSHAESQITSVMGATGLRVGVGGGKDEEEEGGGGRAGSKSFRKDGIVDVASDLSQAATEQPARALRYTSSQETAKDEPTNVCRRRHSRETAREIPACPRRHGSLEVDNKEAAAHEIRHTSLEGAARESAACESRGSSLSKLWPSKSNWSNSPQDSSKSAWIGRSVGSFTVTRVLPGDENVGDDKSSEDRPAAMSAGAPAVKTFPSLGPTGVRVLRKRERPVNSSRNPRAYALETNVFNPLERAPL